MTVSKESLHTEATMTRAELVERIARAIYSQDSRPTVPWETVVEFDPHHAKRVRGHAKAALAAIHDAGCAVNPREIDDALADIGLSSTASWLDIKGSALTVNREKMKRRYQRIVAAADLAKPDA